ncbi:MAG: dethiobiotin synthase [Deltaproteobacteria bacterium]|nr:dethiobiotin synthase [Deltaproteobacteria bacterium]
MKMVYPSRLFIAGTDTGIGKTLVSAILMSGLNAKYWKPVQSGLTGITDTEWIKENTGLDASRFFHETYRLKEPLSPHASAALEGIHIDLESFVIPETSKGEILIIEGAGGIMVPLNEKELMIDLMKRFNAPVILVARSGLGTINHTLLSINQLRQENIEIFGAVMNGPLNKSNRNAIEHFSDIKVIAEIEPMETITPETLKQGFSRYLGKM